MDLSLSSWSFHKPLYEGQMRLWDIPGQAAGLGFEQVELQDMFLWPYGNRLSWWLRRMMTPPSPAPDGRYYDYDLLKRVRQALDTHHLKLSAWNTDPELGRPGFMAKARAYIEMALRTASQLGADLLRVTMDHVAVGDDIQPVIDVLKAVVPAAEAHQVRLGLENHGQAADVNQVLTVIDGVDSAWLGVCLDMGNFKPGEGESGFEQLAPYAIHVHAKSNAFNDDGEETTISYRHRLNTLKSVRYDGTITIEYEGDDDPIQGIRQTETLIRRYLAD